MKLAPHALVACIASLAGTQAHARSPPRRAPAFASCTHTVCWPHVLERGQVLVQRRQRRGRSCNAISLAVVCWRGARPWRQGVSSWRLIPGRWVGSSILQR